MTRETKLHLTLCAAALFCAAIIGLLTRFSFHGSTTLGQLKSSSSTDSYAVQIMEDDGEDHTFAKINDFQSLKENSRVIAKVKVTSDRSLYRNTIYTKVIPEEIYQSDMKLSSNEPVYIYEPADFDEEFKTFDSLAGYHLMETGEEYYVFLNKIKTAPGYKESEKEKISFVPSTTKFSVYSAGSETLDTLNQKKLDGDAESYHYRDIKNLSILTSSQNDLNLYRNIKQELIHQIGQRR